MTIMIVQGPHAAAAMPDQALLDQLKRTAWQRGHAVEISSCATASECIARLRTARYRQVDMVVLAPGELDTATHDNPDDAFAQALRNLPVPYVMVQDREPTTSPLASARAPLVTVLVSGNLDFSYRLALDIALQRLRHAA